MEPSIDDAEVGYDAIMQGIESKLAQDIPAMPIPSRMGHVTYRSFLLIHDVFTAFMMLHDKVQSYTTWCENEGQHIQFWVHETTEREYDICKGVTRVLVSPMSTPCPFSAVCPPFQLGIVDYCFKAAAQRWFPTYDFRFCGLFDIGSPFAILPEHVMVNELFPAYNTPWLEPTVVVILARHRRDRVLHHMIDLREVLIESARGLSLVLQRMHNHYANKLSHPQQKQLQLAGAQEPKTLPSQHMLESDPTPPKKKQKLNPSAETKKGHSDQK